MDNVEALEKVQPKELTAPEISVKLGTTWIENEDYEQFIYELLEIPENNQRNYCTHSGHALKIERLDADMSYHIDRGNFLEEPFVLDKPMAQDLWMRSALSRNC